MIGPLTRYPLNVAGTRLSNDLSLLQPVYVRELRGGTNRWKGTIDHGKGIYQTKSRGTLKNMTYRGCFSLDLYDEWNDILSCPGVTHIEIIIGTDCWVSSVSDWIARGRDEQTKGGPRRLLDMSFCKKVSYAA